MRITSQNLLIIIAATLMATSACQRSPGINGGIVDNGNKPTEGDPSDPEHDNPPGGTKGTPGTSGGVNQDPSTLGVTALKILGERHRITYLPTGLMIREVSSVKTDIAFAIDAPAAVTFDLDGGAICEASEGTILSTRDGGSLHQCSNFNEYTLKASNGDLIAVQNVSLEKELFYSIVRSFYSAGTP